MRIRPLYALAVLAAAFVLTACSKGKDVVGEPAPPFEVTSFSGVALSPEGHKGEPLLIYFFASW